MRNECVLDQACQGEFMDIFPNDLAWLLIHTLPIPIKGDREILRSIASGETTAFEVMGLFADILEKGENKLHEIGESVTSYYRFVKALVNDDQVVIESVVAESKAKFKKETIDISSIAVEITPEILQYVENYVNKIPESLHQRLVIVSGATASGKSELVNSISDDDKYVSLDLDIIRAELARLLGEEHTPWDQRQVLKYRKLSWLVSDLILEKALTENRSVMIQSPLHRDKWLEDKNLQLANDLHIPIDIYYVARPILECAWRNLARVRSVTIDDLVESIEGMSMIPRLADKFKIRKVYWREYFTSHFIESGLKDRFSRRKFLEFIKTARRKSFKNRGPFVHIKSQQLPIKTKD